MKFHPVEGLSFHCNFTITSNVVQESAACKRTIKCFHFWCRDECYAKNYGTGGTENSGDVHLNRESNLDLIKWLWSLINALFFWINHSASKVFRLSASKVCCYESYVKVLISQNSYWFSGFQDDKTRMRIEFNVKKTA